MSFESTFISTLISTVLAPPIPIFRRAWDPAAPRHSQVRITLARQILHYLIVGSTRREQPRSVRLYMQLGGKSKPP
jgi:hypothetical protein